MTNNQELNAYSGEHPSIPENPGYKPLFRFVGLMIVLAVLGELLLEFGWKLAEMLGEGIFYLVEGSEEFIEDYVEERFKLEPWEAERYTAWTMLPVKALLGFLVLRMIWRWKKRRVLPAAKHWLQQQWLLLRLSWQGVWWPWKVVLTIVGLGFLAILI